LAAQRAADHSADDSTDHATNDAAFHSSDHSTFDAGIVIFVTGVGDLRYVAGNFGRLAELFARSFLARRFDSWCGLAGAARGGRRWRWGRRRS
jgi:hypothetical protein